MLTAVQLRKQADDVLEQLVKAAVVLRAAEEEVQLYRNRKDDLQRQYSDLVLQAAQAEENGL